MPGEKDDLYPVKLEWLLQDLVALTIFSNHSNVGGDNFSQLGGGGTFFQPFIKKSFKKAQYNLFLSRNVPSLLSVKNHQFSAREMLLSF